jgi:hypothetical protein
MLTLMLENYSDGLKKLSEADSGMRCFGPVVIKKQSG